MEREHLPQYYTILFSGIADALTAIDQQRPPRPGHILVPRFSRRLRMPLSARRRHKQAGRGESAPPCGVSVFTASSAARWPR